MAADAAALKSREPLAAAIGELIRWVDWHDGRLWQRFQRSAGH
jgi:hypothetical protein